MKPDSGHENDKNRTPNREQHIARGERHAEAEHGRTRLLPTSQTTPKEPAEAQDNRRGHRY